MTFKFEYEFVLPKGFVDEQGTVHREGVMRLATAMDEIAPLRDPRVRSNEAYLVIVLLSQVIVKLGALSSITPAMVERMFAVDIAYLQDFYRQINDLEADRITVTCPNCGHTFEESVPLLGEL
jgi:hypothetical protein